MNWIFSSKAKTKQTATFNLKCHPVISNYWNNGNLN